MSKYIIKENIENTIEIEKSVFITKLIKITSKEEIAKLFNNNIHKDARHNCYGYILDEKGNNYIKFSDDGEPSGTAGQVIYSALKQAEVTNILAIVVRYFGGIKLGKNGLVKAYRRSITEALSKAHKLELLDCYELVMNLDFQEYAQALAVMKELSNIKETNFTENVNLRIVIQQDKFDEFISKMSKLLKKEIVFKNKKEIVTTLE